MPRWQLALMIVLVLGAIGLAGYNAKGSYLYNVISGRCASSAPPAICDQSFVHGRYGFSLPR
jgi:hypothetical protein